MSNTATFPHAVSPDSTDDAMNGEREEREERRRSGMRDRRDQNPWTDPRFIVQLISMLIITAGGMVGIYAAMRAETATLTLSATNIKETASEIKGQVAAIAANVQSVTQTTAELKADFAARGREIEDMKRIVQMMEARIIVLEKSVARAEGRGNRGD